MLSDQPIWSGSIFADAYAYDFVVVAVVSVVAVVAEEEVEVDSEGVAAEGEDSGVEEEAAEDVAEVDSTICTK